VALRQDQISRGLATRQQVLTAERDVESLRTRRSQLQTQIRSAQAQINTLEGQTRAAFLRASSAQGEVKIKDVGLEVVSQIKSEVEGRIIELRVKQGDIVQAGTTLAVVEPLDAELQTIIYFDSRQARQIRNKMEAQISPTEIRREEFGFIKGVVVSVSDAPVTMEKMARDLANQTLAQELYGKVAPIEVRATLNPAKSENATGFEWSTSAGPPFPIAGNSRINVDIVVDRRKPYTYVLPMIKSAIGAS
jgi:HlyD family secretion protein